DGVTLGAVRQREFQYGWVIEASKLEPIGIDREASKSLRFRPSAQVSRIVLRFDSPQRQKAGKSLVPGQAGIRDQLSERGLLDSCRFRSRRGLRRRRERTLGLRMFVGLQRVQ